MPAPSGYIKRQSPPEFQTVRRTAWKSRRYPRLALFTSKERGQESGLDYFGARYYGSALGRFTSPDSGVDQHPIDPQSWNLYSYVRNNPLTSIDPSGDYMCGASMTAAQCDSFQGSLNHAQTAADQIKATYGADSTQYKD